MEVASYGQIHATLEQKALIVLSEKYIEIDQQVKETHENSR